MKFMEGSGPTTELYPPAPVATIGSHSSQAMLSIGSNLHQAGMCTPCSWFWKDEGCRGGRNCRRCHLCPKGEIRSRKKVRMNLLRSSLCQDDTACPLPKNVEACGPVSAMGSSSGSDAAAPSEMSQVDCPTPPEIPSRGSALHSAGLCQPCSCFWKEGGCQNGNDCRRCHLCPKGEVKNRRRMKVALMRADGTSNNALNESIHSSNDSSALSGSEHDSGI